MRTFTLVNELLFAVQERRTGRLAMLTEALQPGSVP